MTAPNGKIRDIPWEYWTTAIKAKTTQINEETELDDNEGFSKIELSFIKCCDKQDLRYTQSERFEDLRGISIVCENCKKRNTLTGLFGLLLADKQTAKIENKDDKEIKAYFKTVIRSSNSVYYPVLVSGLYLPSKDIS